MGVLESNTRVTRILSLVFGSTLFYGPKFVTERIDVVGVTEEKKRGSFPSVRGKTFPEKITSYVRRIIRDRGRWRS